MWPTIHGRSRTPEWRAWKAMLQRCRNPRCESYPNYGGRGIAVCERWQGENGFANFFADIGSRPTPKHTLERTDNERGYEPGNVRWATRAEQNRNKRSIRWITVNGVTGTVADWSRRTGLQASTIRRRLIRGVSPAEAISRLEGGSRVGF